MQTIAVGSRLTHGRTAFSVSKGWFLFFDHEEFRRQILRSRHDAPVAGHQGRAKTLELVSRDFISQHCAVMFTATSMAVTPANVPSPPTMLATGFCNLFPPPTLLGKK